MHSSAPGNAERADRWLLRGMTAASVAVAAIAAVQSYTHIYEIAAAHGEAGLDARLLPLSVDGLIVAASLVLLYEARQRRRAPFLARMALVLGIGATVAANIGYGAVWGAWGIAAAAWPAVAFVIVVELLMALLRSAARREPGKEPEPFRPAAPADAEEAARMAYQASVAGGNPLSERALAGRFGISRAAAQRVRSGVAAESNGHGSPAAAGAS